MGHRRKSDDVADPILRSHISIANGGSLGIDATVVGDQPNALAVWRCGASYDALTVDYGVLAEENWPG